ncbi:signal transduction histidine kinase/NO-binding membrane sensor protein with MHYT domain/CheY-like chemotaxis protein [Brevundimonas vesicularis]|uniref:ATP-binding protein n=1 Tax=Brevundimonas vesicularis TaxID=41276 RepID=UPI002788A7E5|nr:ATP-binding protein [Brevundimonas vesicularis]MDQ1193257.1 signal transduction histidine kinase/NO-binding membrane sensor protein with MHYT domain/CheY-like chemotaxis protein [Brevundimonas vesicularis]
MDRIIHCIAHDHDWRITVFAALICMAGLGVSTHVMQKMGRRDPDRRRRSVLLAVMIGALSIWATHFVAMQGFVAGVPVRYNPFLTVASLGIALAMIGLTISSTLMGKGRMWRVLAAVIAVAGVGAMHYLGMAAIKAPAHISWDPGLVALSIIAALAIGGATAFFYRRGGLLRLLATTTGLSATVIVLHFIGMAAITVTPDPTVAADQGLSSEAMRLLLAAILLMICTAAAVLGMMAYISRATALRRIREAVDAMPDGLGFYDSKDRLVLWNARYAEVNPELEPHLVVGLTFREALRIGIDEGRYQEAAGREEEWLNERMQARRQLSSNSEQQVAGGRWLRIQDRRTSEGGTVTVCNDITDLKRDAEALSEARDAAEAANVAKSQFLANMSHEIRTPLNGVIGLSQALAKTDLTAEQREMLDLMQASGKTLQTLLSDILDLARVESGKLELTEDAFELATVVREAAQLYAENAREKHLDFHVDIDLEDDVWILGDAVRLKQILTNLISNAVKFTSKGFVGLIVQRGADREGSPVLRFTVEDSGIGFDAATRARLFSRFEQADGGITRKFGGSGLGLSICRQLAEMMGGDLGCESEPGGGAAFILTFPLRQTEAPARKEPAPAQPAVVEQARTIRVLVADDHPTNRRVIELILAQTPTQIVIAENGAQAVESFRADTFDLVLMDMQMPIMDGLTATQEIRLHEATMGLDRTPIVMLTANAMPEHIAAGRAAGADHHLAKPFNAAELLGIVAAPTSLLKDRARAA